MFNSGDWNETEAADESSSVAFQAGQRMSKRLKTISPTGTITLFAGTHEPQGWFFCNGQSVLQSEYPKLFDVIGMTFGTGDGNDTFNVPNLPPPAPNIQYIIRHSGEII